MEDIIWHDFFYDPIPSVLHYPDLSDDEYIDPDSFVREEYHRWDFNDDNKSVLVPKSEVFEEGSDQNNIDIVKKELNVEYVIKPSVENDVKPNELLVASDTGKSDFTQLLDNATTFFKTVCKCEQNDDENDPLESTPHTCPKKEQPLYFEQVTIDPDDDNEYECDVKMIKVDPSMSPTIDDPLMIEAAVSVEETPELLECLKRSFDTNPSSLPHPSLYPTEVAADTKEEVIFSIPLKSPQVSEEDQVNGEVPPELVKFLNENFPNEHNIELVVEDFDSSELVPSSPLVSCQGTLDPCYFQGNGIDEDKCLPKVELPFFDGPSDEPMIIPYPKSTNNSKAAKKSRSSARMTLVQKALNNNDFEFTCDGMPEENQENVPVEDSSRTTRKRKPQGSSRNKKILKEQDDIRFWQRQEVVEARNLRPRKLKTNTQSVESVILKTPKPKQNAPKRKRGRPRLFKNQPSSTPLVVKVEKPEEPDASELSPLMVSPIRLIRRLSIPYKARKVKDGSSTLSANSSTFNLSGSSGEGISYDRTPEQSAVVLPNIKTEPATLWFNPKSTYSPNTEKAKPAVLVVDAKATRSLGNRQKRQIKTEPATVVFSRKNSEATISTAIKTKNSCEDSPGCYIETFPPYFEKRIKTEKENSESRKRSIKIEKKSPILRSSNNRAASDIRNLNLKSGTGSAHSYRHHTNAEPSTIDHQKRSIKREPLTLVVNPTARSRKLLIKTEAENLIPNPKAARNFHGEFDSSSGIRPTRKRVRYAKEEYACRICEYKCTVESSLYNHVACHLNHTYVEPLYSCDICGLDSNSEKDSALHMMAQHKEGTEFKCDRCMFQTGQLKKLVQHRRRHTVEKPHLCYLCDYRSTRRDNLHSHARRIHHIPRMDGDTFTQPNINWEEIQKRIESDNNNNLSQSFE